jgi:hypothetical protein
MSSCEAQPTNVSKSAAPHRERLPFPACFDTDFVLLSMLSWWRTHKAEHPEKVS